MDNQRQRRNLGFRCHHPQLPNKNCRPCVPRGHKDGMNVSLIWLNGTYTGMGGANYLMAVRMYPTDIPVAVRQTRSGRPHDMNMQVSGNGISFTLSQPQYSSLTFTTSTED